MYSLLKLFSRSGRCSWLGILLLWTFLFIFGPAHGQGSSGITIVNPFPGNQEVAICSIDSLVIPVVRDDGMPFQSNDSVRFDLNLPTGLTLLQANGPELAILQQSANSINCRVGTTVLEDTLWVNLIVDVGCDFFSSNPNQVYQVTGTAEWRQVGVGSIDTQTLTNRFVTIQHGVLTPLQVTNQTTNTPLQGTIERCFYYMNTSTQHALSADIVFQDSVLLQGPSNWIEFTDLYIQPKPWITSSATSLSDSLVTFTVSVTNMPPLDTIIFCDSVKLVECPSGSIDSSQTEYSLTYGCPGKDRCQDLSDPIQNLTSLQRTPGAPNLSYTRLSGGLSCPADSNTVIFRVRNNGSANAFGAAFSAYYLRPNRLTDLDPNTVEVYRLGPGGQKLPFNFTYDPTKKLYPGTSHASFEFHVEVDTLIPVGDTFYIEFQEFQHCPDTMDHEVLFGWNGVYIGTLTLMGRLKHNCLPSTKRMTYNNHQFFRVRQFFDNLLSTMTDGQQAWFNVQSLQPLIAHFAHPNNYPIAYDPTRFRIAVDIMVDSGLCFVNQDSVYLYGNARDTIIWPESTTVIPGNGPFCTNDTLRAVFAIPANFIKPNGQYHPLFKIFFNDFQARFKLRADCGFVNFNATENPRMLQEFFVIYDTACAPDCRIPIGRASERIQINCPGCYLPGWNLSAFNITRMSIGESDTNDNHFPDFVPVNQPADPSDVNLQQIKIGDTVALDINAFVSDGDPIDGYTFSQLTFDYDHGVFYIPGNALLQQMDLIGVELTLHDGSGTPFNATITASNPGTANLWILNNTTGAFSLDLDATAWQQLGLSSFTSYGPNHSLDLRLIMEVTGNLTGGSGLPFMGVYDASAFVYMSGTPFNLANPQQKVDALTIDQNDITNPALYSMNDLEQLMYWCTGWEGRVRGIGISYNQGGGERPLYYKNICLKALQFRAWGSSGQHWNSWRQGLRPAAYDVFPNELRNIYMMDSLVVELPTNYRVTNTNISFSTVWNRGNGNQRLNAGRAFPPTHIENRPSDVKYRFFDLPNQFVTDPTLLPTGAVNQSVYASFFGESKSYWLNVFFLPDDCQQNLNERDTLRFTAYYKNDPLSDQPRVSYGVFNLRRPDPNFVSNVNNFQIDNNNDITFDFNIRANNIGVDFAPNVFFFARSQSGNTVITSMTRNGNNVAQVGTHQGSPIFFLGNVTGREPHASNYNYQLAADYDCSTVNGNDTLILYYGYKCDSALTEVDSTWCEIDSVKIPIIYQFPGLQANTFFPDTVNTCDTVWYEVDLNATGNRRVEQVRADLTLPAGLTIPPILSGSLPQAQLLYDGTTTVITATGTGPGLTFDLDTLLPDFVGTLGKTANLRIPMLFDCSFRLPATGLLEVSATDFCGKSLQDITATFGPSEVEGTFDFGDLDLFALQYTPLLTCQDSGDYSITIQNNSSDLSGWFQVNYYCEGDINGPVQPLCLIGSTAPMQLAGNSTQTLLDRLPPMCPDCEQILAVIEPIDTCNCGDNTDTVRTTVDCTPCAMQAEFTYSITEGCVLNLFDQTTGTQSVGSWSWTVSDQLTGQVLVTSNQANPVLPGITTHYLDVCLIVTGTPDSTCADTICYPVELCCVPEPDTCVIDPLFSVTGNQCHITFTDFSSVTTTGTVSYEWSVRPPGALAFTVYPVQTNPVFNYTVQTAGVHDVCLKVITSDGCTASICKTMAWGACPDLCNCDGEIEYTFDSTACTYDFFVAGAPSGLISYFWEVNGPTSQPTINPNASAANVSVSPLENGNHQVCVTLVWVRGLDTCEQKICRMVNMELCPEPCEFEGEIDYSVDPENCLYDIFLVNAPANIVSYTWTVNGPTTNPTIQPSNSAPSINITPLENGIHIVCLEVVWTDGVDTCRERICREIEMKRCVSDCEFDGEIGYSFDEENCIYDIFIANGPANIVSYAWTVNGPTTNPTIQPSANAPSINITALENGIHIVCLEVVWTDGVDTCKERICREIEMKRCESDCEFDGEIGYNFDEENCIYDIFLANGPANIISYAWTVNGPTTNPTIQPSANAPSINITALENGIHIVCLEVVWTDGVDTCKERICREIEMKRCVSDCEFNGEIGYSFDEENCIYDIFLANGPANIISYTWTVNGPTTNPTIQPSANAPSINITALENGIHIVCLEVVWTDGVDTCKERICREIEMKRCVSDCTFDGEIGYSFDEENCIYDIFLANGPANIISYTWTVNGPTTNPTIQPSANAPSINITALENGIHVICLEVIWTDGVDTCRERICREIEMKRCVSDCEFDGEIGYSFYEENCIYDIFLANGPANIISYTWTVNGPTTNPTIQPSANAPSINITALENGIHVVCLEVVWTDGVDTCKERICREIEMKRCESDCNFDGEINVRFDEQKCVYHFDVGNAPANVISYNWTVTAPTTNPVIQPNPSNPSIWMQPLETAVHIICVTVTWIDGGDTCSEQICREIDLKRCDGGCEFEGQIDVNFDDRRCRYFFDLVNGPANVINYTWTVNGPTTNPTILPNANAQSISISPLENGTHLVCLEVIWTNGGDTCEERICREVELKRCPSDCEFEGEIGFDVDEENCIYDIFLNNAPGNIISYNWTVSAPTTNPMVNPNASAPSISISPLESALHTVCVTVTWTDGVDTCAERICRRIEMKRCESDCTFEGEIVYDVDEENCIYDISLINGPANIISYNWIVNGPSTNPSIQPSVSAPSINVTPLENGIHVVCLEVYWTNGGDTCKERICREIEMKRCESDCIFDGEIKVDFDEQKCTYHFAVGNPPANVIGYNWTVTAPTTNPVIQPNATNPTISVQALETAVHIICVTVTWVDAGDTCSQQICREIDLKHCDEPCDYVGEIGLAIDRKTCEHKVWLQPLPNASSMTILWTVTDPNGNPVSFTGVNNQPSAGFIPLLSGTYQVCVTIYWVIDGQECKKRFCQSYDLEGCDLTDPCDRDWQLDARFLEEECLYRFDLSPDPTANPGYLFFWWIQGPNSNQVNNLTLSNQPVITLQPNGGGTYRVCVLVIHISNGEICTELVCEEFKLKDCVDEIQARTGSADHLPGPGERIVVPLAPGSGPARYELGFRQPDGSVIPSGEATEEEMKAPACLTLTWDTPEGPQSTTICQGQKGEKADNCFLNGRILWELQPNGSEYELKFSDAANYENLSYHWKVVEQGGGTYGNQLPLQGGAEAPVVRFQQKPGRIYRVFLTLKWTSNGQVCEDMLLLNLKGDYNR